VSLATIVGLAQEKSMAVRMAQADLQKVGAQYLQSRDAFIPSITFGSGLPAFPSVGFTGSLPTIWDANVQSMVFSMQQIRYIQAGKAGIEASQLNLKDAREQVALDASVAYIELDSITRELEAARQQEQYAARVVEIEQQRTEAGVDPLNRLLQAQLTTAQIKLSRLHLETRATTLAKQLSILTGLPPISIITDHASIPEIPSLNGENAAPSTAALDAARAQARSLQLVAKGDEERSWTPQIGFGVQYNRSTTLLNDINTFYARDLPANNVSSGFSISVPLFDAGLRDKARESAADALKARIQAEQVQRQYDQQLTMLNGTLRELDTQAEIARLKQQIADDQLRTVIAEMEVGNGASAGAPGSAQLSPTTEQEARMDERQKFQDALEAGFMLSRTRLGLVRSLGHMQDWLNELHQK
jgi:outer membrane protein TolC